MLINNYNPNQHKGGQPIRVLEANISSFDSLLDNRTRQELIDLVGDGSVSPGIAMHAKELPLIDLRDENNSQLPFIDKNIIHLHETFLSYLWTICYSFLVIFNEGVDKPFREGRYSGIIEEKDDVKKAYQLFDYGLSLIHNYNEWDKINLPNPELYDQSNRKHIENTNGLYIFSVVCIILHEVAHASLCHLSHFSKFDQKMNEQNADNYALNHLLNSLNTNPFKTNISLGIVSTLCALLFLNGVVYSETHPDIDKRILNAIQSIEGSIGKRDTLYGYVCIMFRLWDIKYKLGLTWPSETDSYEDLFKKIEKKIYRTT